MTAQAVRILMEVAPPGLDVDQVRARILTLPGVADVHDLHIWALSTTSTALAAHVVWQGTDRDAFIDQVTDALAEDHGIARATLQLERRPCDRAA